MCSGRPGQTSAKRAIAVSAAACASTSAGKHWQNSDSTCRPWGARVASTAVWQAASIHGAPAGRPARASAAAAARSGEREADVDRALPRLRAGPGGEVGQPVEQQHHLHHRPRLPPARRRGQARQAGGDHRVGVGEHRPGPDLPPALQHHAPRRAALHQHRLDRRRRADAGARRLGRAPQRPGDRSHPSAGVAPRSGDPARLAEVVVEGDERGARVLGPGQGADQALDCERHAHRLARGCTAARRRSSPPGARAPPPPASASRSAGSSSSGRARAAARLAPSRPAPRSASASASRPVLGQLPVCALEVRPGDHAPSVGQRGEQVGLVHGRPPARGAAARRSRRIVGRRSESV